MSEFRKLAMTLFIILFLINAGLLSMKLHNPDLPIPSGSATLSQYQDLNTQAYATRPVDEDGNPCPGYLSCKKNVASGTWENINIGFDTAMKSGAFIISTIFDLLFGYHNLINFIADKLEEGAGAVHVLLWGISGTFTVIAMYGLFSILSQIIFFRRT